MPSIKNIEITDFPLLPSEIKQAINDEKLAIFIGAGVSRLIGCDGWDTLATNLVKKCAEENLIEPITKELLLKQSDQIKLISICHNVLDSESFMQTMRESLKDSEIDNLVRSDDKFQIYKDLKNIGSTFITTNADRFIDKLLDGANIYINKFGTEKIDDSNHKLYKIHGCISDEDSLVFTKDKYMFTYTNSKFINFIEGIFTKYTVLFVGYGLNEFDLLSKVFQSALNKEPQHFLLKPYFLHEHEVCNLEYEYFEGIGIRLIPFSRDKKDYEQLIGVISNWHDETIIKTRRLQKSFTTVDNALESPSSNSIATTIQNMRSDENQVRYFFSKAHSYQKLHLWLKPLFDAEFLSLNESNEFQYSSTLTFLEKVSIQNREDEKSEITKKLLLIANRTIEKTTDDHIVWHMIKVIFNLPIENISLDRINFIDSHVRDCKHRSILNFDIAETVMPVLIKNEKRKHILKLLPLIFGYTLKKDTLSYVEPISIIGEHNLQELLRRHSKDMIKLVGLGGLKIVVESIKDITKQEKSTFNPASLAAVRTKTDDEITQNIRSYHNRYAKQLVFFTRDLFEILPSAEIKPCIKDFLLKQQHSIFIRLALHIINCKYEALKDIFWQWWANINKEKTELRTLHEFWVLLKESSENFTIDEFDKIIDWIEAYDCRKYLQNDNDETIKLCNAYRRKEWLLCLKDNNERAKNLYQKYDSINDRKVRHPGFSYWLGGIHEVPKYSHPNKKEFCEDPINIIKNSDPLQIDRGNNFDDNESLKMGLANDLSTCIKNDPVTFAGKIDEFKDLEHIYKNRVIQGFSDAWKEKREFDWEKIFNFIDNELSANFFSSNENQKQWFVSEIASLIECGTREDSNAFNKTLLPRAKEILLKLLNNKYEEKGVTSDNLTSHVLNSTNGKVLHALIDYSLRYGRLNSTQSVKWEKEVKAFFTEQLEENNLYSKSVFTVLGTYFHHLEFLDNNWATSNFNKIFPLKNKQLWKVSIKAYFLHTNTVYEETYNLFKDNGHIKEMLLPNFKEDEIKSRLVSFVCIAYINDMDNNTIFDIINLKNTSNILKITQSILQVYKDEKNECKKDKIKTIWYKIYENYKSDNSEDVQKIFSELCSWFVFLYEIPDKDMELLKYDKDMELLKYTAKHAKDSYQARNLIKEMARLSVDYTQEVSEIYKYIIANDIYPTYRKEDVKKILDNLNPNDSLEIVNYYRQKGIYI